MKSALAGLAFGALLGAAIAIGACAGAQHPDGASKRGEITALWTQIRDWRREARMDLDPSTPTIFQVRALAVKDTKRVCSEGHKVPTTCDDVCNLADAICDNAETICSIADELGKDDREGQDRCASGKASCAEAKKNCCECTPVEAAP